MTAWDAVSGALTANDVGYVANGTYLSSVNSLAEYASPDYSVYYGWMYAVDNVVPAVGLGDAALSGDPALLRHRLHHARYRLRQESRGGGDGFLRR